MVRMIISLPEADKKWLEQTGRRGNISSAEVVRRAVAHLRKSDPEASFQKAIGACTGRWPAGGVDSQTQVDAMRDEWASNR